jgi:hypothetical protein
MTAHIAAARGLVLIRPYNGCPWQYKIGQLPVAANLNFFRVHRALYIFTQVNICFRPLYRQSVGRKDKFFGSVIIIYSPNHSFVMVNVNSRFAIHMVEL